MGTFHDGKGELHGITVVVETPGSTVYIGRCWEMNEERIVLLDVDEHQDSGNGQSRQEFIRQAAKVGVWKKHDKIVVPMSSVSSVTRLGDVTID
ncbi:MAG TPA: hypothetical protein VLC48_06920 [Gemmatimonadota bacterium]|nr:hypothetical protein [Gemmatimonadota bacterium]